MDAVRKLIQQRAAERGLNLAQLSRQVGKNHAYMQQFINRGVPSRLPEDVRSRLADVLDLDETALGGSPRGTAHKSRSSFETVDIPRHNVRGSAGPGTLVDQERAIGTWPFPREYLRHELSLRTNSLSIIPVVGDSMEPTLKSGDVILVDLSDHNVSQPGIFALYDGDATVVKRLEKIPSSHPAKIRLISDNPKHTAYDVLIDTVNVAGRVVWFGRRL